MTQPTQITWLIGSPKPKESTSEALGQFFVDQFEGAEVSVFHAHKVIRHERNQTDFLSALDAADLFVISFPLYVDCLPYVVTRVLELISVHRQGNRSPQGQGMVAISNCGFPEAHHNAIALDICEVFAEETGFAWRGGIAIGGGGVIHGQPLSPKGVTHRICAAFVDAAVQITRGEAIYPETLSEFERPLIPARAYTTMGTIGWFSQARENDVRWPDLWQKPYLKRE
jgi:hypothetical protein